MRSLRITQEASDPETAIILLDFILGFNASKDPVGEAIDSILTAKKKAESQNRHLTFIASITGTEEDPQDLTLQRKMLECADIVRCNTRSVSAEIINARKVKMDQRQCDFGPAVIAINRIKQFAAALKIRKLSCEHQLNASSKQVMKMMNLWTSA
jgi:hypothetical protein